MRVRILDANGDYTFGQGSANFWVNKAEGVGQNVTTRLKLFEGEWFLDKTIGTPWSQEVLGYNTASLRDMLIKTVILQTFGVSAILSYSSDFNANTREFTVQATILTIYSPQAIAIGPIVL